MNKASSGHSGLSKTLVKEEEEEEDEEGEERARCDWDFHLSAVISPTATGEVSDTIGAIEFDPTHRLLATGGISRKIRIYNLSRLVPPEAAYRSTPTFSDHSRSCEFFICTPAKLSSLRWRPDSGGRVIGSGDYDGVVTEYDLERQAAVFERDEHGGRRVWSVDYSVDGALGASASDDCTAQLWDTRCGGGAVAVAVARAGGSICSVEFEPGGGPWIGVGSADRHAYVYDLRAVEAGPVAVFGGHGRAVTYVRFAGGRRVVTSGTDGSHRLWEWEEGRQVRAYRGHVNGRSFVGMSVWRAAGLVCCGSESNEVFVYDLRWGQPIWTRGFSQGGGRRDGFVSAANWRQGSPDGEAALAGGGSDGVLQVFHCRRKAEHD